jgi:hypothetical protein
LQTSSIEGIAAAKNQKKNYVRKASKVHKIVQMFFFLNEFPGCPWVKFYSLQIKVHLEWHKLNFKQLKSHCKQILQN